MGHFFDWLAYLFYNIIKADKAARGNLHPGDKRTYIPEKSRLEKLIEERKKGR